jgi:hypothetical protein
MNREEMKERIEELEEKVEELERSSDSAENGVVEGEKTLYVYIRYHSEEIETPLGDFDEYQYFILYNDGVYRIPQENVFNYMSNVRQAEELVKKYFDCWDEIEVVANSDDAIYYCASIPESEVDSADQGSWVSKQKLHNLLSSFEEQEYLMEI